MVTYILIGINIIVWASFNLYAYLNGFSAVDIQASMGGQIDYLVFQGEVFRVVTSMFLHVNITHLLMNMYALFILGKLVENTYGKARFIIIYFLSGIMGNVVSFAFISGSSMGASGAIFGLVGASVIIALNSHGEYRKRLLLNAGFVIIASAAMGATVNINQFAHFGGLIGGLLLTSILIQIHPQEWYINRLFNILLFIAILIISIYLGVNNPINQAQKLVATIQSQYKLKHWVELEKTCEELLTLKGELKDGRETALWYVCDAENQLKKYKESLAHAKEMKSYNLAEGYYLEGFPYLNQGMYKEAKNSFTQAKNNGSTQPDINGILAKIPSST